MGSGEPELADPDIHVLHAGPAPAEAEDDGGEAVGVTRTERRAAVAQLARASPPPSSSLLSEATVADGYIHTGHGNEAPPNYVEAAKVHGGCMRARARPVLHALRRAGRSMCSPRSSTSKSQVNRISLRR